MQLIKKVYQTLLPYDLRWKLRIYRERSSGTGQLRKDILQHYATLPEAEKPADVKAVLRFIQQYGVITFPYPFAFDQNPDQVHVYRDAKLGLPYVLLDGKRLYYKRTWSEKEIQESFNFLTIEQHPNSPHRYLTSGFKVNKDDVVVDIGAAEGNFSLGIVEQAAKVYIFEADQEWMEALEATFAPWREKVEIIHQYVSDTDTASTIQLDTFLQGKGKADFLKIDVEGAESQILRGARQSLLQTNGMKVAICTYHRQKDAVELGQALKEHAFNITYSDGYMLFLEDEQSPPYLRKGLIRATK
ncbi:FkbM family methyltransferase [Pontibacter sp. CAU 1760]